MDQEPSTPIKILPDLFFEAMPLIILFSSFIFPKCSPFMIVYSFNLLNLNKPLFYPNAHFDTNCCKFRNLFWFL